MGVTTAPKPKHEERIEVLEEYLELMSDFMDHLVQQLQPGVRLFSFNYYKNNREEIQENLKKMREQQNSRIVSLN